MSSFSDPWRRLTPAGKIVLPLVALLVLGIVAFTALWVVGVGPAIYDLAVDTAEANIGIVRFLVAATGILLFTVPAAFVIIFMELKIIAFMNLRLGPNRVGPWGTLSSTIHGLKVLAKEDFTPTGVDVPGLHAGAGGGLPGRRPDAPGHPLRAGHGGLARWSSGCSTSSPSAASASSA